MATPTLVQHVLYHSNCNFETGQDFILPLPNATLANNCLVLFMTYAYSASRTVTIKDQSGTTLISAPTLKTDDTGNGLTTAVFVIPGAAAGVTSLKVTFDAALYAVTPAFQEWYNVATSSPLDGTGAAANTVVAAAVTSGSFTTGVNGSVVIQHAIDTNYGPQLEGGYFDGITGVAKDTGYTMMHADRMLAVATQYKVQATAGAVNPAITYSGGSAGSVSFNSLTIALKAATAGTAPSSAGARIFGVQHTRIKMTGSGNYTQWAPLTGSLAVLASAYGSNGTGITSCTGSVSGAWSILGVSQPSDYPQMAYKSGLSASDSDVLTLALTSGGSGDLQFLIYDILNGGALSGSAVANVGPFGPGSATIPSGFVPSVNNGIAIGACGMFTGPPDALSAPTGAIFDSGYYTGYTDLSPFDSGDAYGHYLFSSNAAQSWTWHDTAATTAANATVAAFASIGLTPTINTQPVDANVAIGTTASFSVAATSSGGSLTYQWQDNSGGSFANVSGGSGATSATYTTATTTSAFEGRLYQCIVTDSNGSVTTRAARLDAVTAATPGAFDQGLVIQAWF